MKLRVKVDAHSFEVEVGDLNARPVIAVVDGETFEVWPEEAEKADAVLTPPSTPVERKVSGPVSTPPVGAVAPVNKMKAVVAPIPGVILSITAKEGDAVSFGQELCVLEAMKMKNIIRANRSGIIGAVRVAIGDQVRHNQVLVEFTD